MEFHLYELPKQTKLIYGEKNKTTKYCIYCLWQQETDWERKQGTFRVMKMVCLGLGCWLHKLYAFVKTQTLHS